MRRESVESSVLTSVGYDLDGQVLELEFVGGAIYRYFGVSVDLYTGLMTAESHGSFFDAHIRDGDFECERLA
jgi:hypothetical protein